MLKLFVCKHCQHFFPAPYDQDANCPKCKELSILTEYFMADLATDSTKVTREIHKKYNIEHEEFVDMIDRVDREERWSRSIIYLFRRLFRAIKRLFIFLFRPIKKLFTYR